MDSKLRRLLCPKPAFGALMGRADVGTRVWYFPVRDVAVPVNAGGYDPGVAYWGVGLPLRCRFQLDSNGQLVWKEFYRGQRKGGQQ